MARTCSKSIMHLTYMHDFWLVMAEDRYQDLSEERFNSFCREVDALIEEAAEVLKIDDKKSAEVEAVQSEVEPATEMPVDSCAKSVVVEPAAMMDDAGAKSEAV